MSIKLQTVGLVVKNMPKTLAFYRVLGLNIPQAEDDAPNVEFEGAGGLVLGFDIEEVVIKTDPKWRALGGQRLSLQFEMESPAAVDSVYEKLIAAGAEEYAAPLDAFWGQRFARVIDPDGNVIGIFAELQDKTS